jgi:hypothetical protein
MKLLIQILHEGGKEQKYNVNSNKIILKIEINLYLI